MGSAPAARFSPHGPGREKCSGLQPAGTVRLGAPDDYALRFLTDALAHFARSHPAVQVDVTCDLSGRLVEAVSADLLDLTLAARRVGAAGATADPPGGRLLVRESLVWALPRRAPVPPLDPLPLALMPEGCPLQGDRHRCRRVGRPCLARGLPVQTR